MSSLFSCPYPGSFSRLDPWKRNDAGGTKTFRGHDADWSFGKKSISA